jgi:glycosyltransferase involved in cell wall biosynthesis
MIVLGSVEDSTYLSQLYSAADMTILTSKKETFSMVCAESLSCGTPVVGFKAGAPEQISLSEYSEFVEHGDMEALQSSVEKLLNTKFNHQDISQAASATYAKEVMAENYIRTYQQLLKE